MRKSKSKTQNRRVFNSSHKKILSVVLAVVLLGTSMVLAKDKPEKSNQKADLGYCDSGAYSVILGDSARIISSEEDLLQLAKEVNDGDDMAGQGFKLTADLGISNIDNWEPIGTNKHPFSGIFDGGNHTISGVGSPSAPAVFGTIKDATLQNIVVKISGANMSGRAYPGLFLESTNSSIINCRIETFKLEVSRLLMNMSAFSADTSWTPSTPGTNQVDSPGRLLQLANLVASGQNFQGYEFSFDLTLNNEFVDTWVGIGTEANPFSGDIVGGTVKGLKAHQPGEDYVGLIGYADGCKISDLKMINVDIKGNKHVGAIAGFGKDVEISDCSVSGSVSGAKNVGGLVGTLFMGVNKNSIDTGIASTTENGNFQNTIDTPMILRSYSTANISGSYRTGGIVGMAYLDPDIVNPGGGSIAPKHVVAVQECFSTGRINASLNTGGIVGTLYGVYDPDYRSSAPGPTSGLVAAPYMLVRKSASDSYISGTSTLGGIVGEGGAATGSYDAFFGNQIENCYFSGTVRGYSPLGGITAKDFLYGLTTTVSDSYVSGNVISPIAHLTGELDVYSTKYPVYVSAIARSDYSDMTPNTINTWANPNTVYSSIYPSNYDPNDTSRQLSYKIDDALGITSYFNGTAPSMSAEFSGDFTTGYSSANHWEKEATGGRYPQLNDFVSGAPIFAEFSNISTNPLLKTIPSTAIMKNGVMVDSITLNPVTLPTSSWSFDGSPTYHVEDAAYENGVTFSISGSQIVSDNAPTTENAITLVSGGASELSKEYNITVKDSGVGTDYQGLKDVYSTTQAEAKTLPQEKRINTENYNHTVPFTEAIAVVSGKQVVITEYSSSDFTGSSTTKNIGPRVIQQNNLRIAYGYDYLKADTSYKVSLPAGLVKDQNGNESLAADYYFITAKAITPKITFVHNTEIETELGAAGDLQTFEMIENDTRYHGINMDITGDEGQQILDNEIEPKTFTIISTVAKQGVSAQNYPKYEDLNLTNFHRVPGTYKVEYQAKVGGIESNMITRTFKITSEAKIMQGSEPYSMLDAEFDDVEAKKILESAKGKGIEPYVELNQELAKRYIGGTDGLSAYIYTPDAQKQNIEITFDTSKVVQEKHFIEGIDTIAYFNTSDGSESKLFSLSIASIEPSREIILKNDTVVFKNTFSTAKARKEFGAYVYNKRTGERTEETVYYNFDDIDKYKFGVAQEVTMTLEKDPRPNVIAGKDMVIKAKGVIIIEREDVLGEPYSADKERALFWETVISHVRAAKDDRTLTFALNYHDSKAMPTNFLKALENKNNVTVELKFASGITLTFNSEEIDSKNDQTINYNIAVEPVYDIKVNRDANGYATQQFTSDEIVNLPAEVKLSVELNEELKSAKNLNFYEVDEKTGEYKLVDTIGKPSIDAGKLEINTEELQGRYVITAAEFGSSKEVLDESASVSLEEVGQISEPPLPEKEDK